MEAARPAKPRPTARPPARLEPAGGEGPGRSTRAERWLARRALRALGDPPISLVLWDGAAVEPPGARPQVRLRLADRRVLFDFLLRPDPAVCDAYLDGRLFVEGDLRRLLELLFGVRRSAPVWIRPLSRALGGALLPRTRRRASRNVHHHYDIGNDFYSLWLDERLVYTCAYFPTPEVGLEEAQLAKFDHVCRKLDLRPGERVVEAGCGWGGLALHMAERYGARVRAFNISHEQIAHAREEAGRRGLEGRVEFIEDDYRSITGRCDAFVSVGMLEHVGRRHYRRLGRVIDRCLEPDGRGLLHFIGRARPTPMSPWFEQRIFPGAYLPSLRQMLTVLEPRGLAVLDVENLRRHYAKTLEHWLARFEKTSPRVEAMFDARFVRTWRLYLIGSLLSFATGSSELFQVLFARRGNDALPWTRAGLYVDADG